MPRPIHPRNFGNTSGSAIRVTYHNGTSVVTGYIVKQLGSTKYRVTTNGTNMFVVQLAQTTAAAQSLTAGFCTVVLAPFGNGPVEYARKITSRRVWTTAGNVYSWAYVVPTATGLARVSTVGDDTTPAAFSFTDVANATTNTVYTSANVVITGITAPTPITISGTGATYSVNGGAFVSTGGWISNGTNVRARITSSANAATTVNAVVTIGTVSDTYSVTTAT